MKLWKKKEFEEVEYEPRSVREILTEMKDISEVIVDLAYAAVLFNSSEIAEEVRLLEVEMDKLKYQLQMTVMLGARTTEDAEQLSGVLQVANATEHISNAAGDIVSLLKTHMKAPILPSVLKEGDEIISFIRVPEAFKGVRIEDIYDSVSAGLRVLAVKRGKRWFYDPDDEMPLRGNDRIVVSGIDEDLEELKKYLGERA